MQSGTERVNITVWNSHPIYVCSNKQHIFFYWCYNPLWVLFFSVIFFHSALPSHSFLHRLTPIICKSSSMPAIHLFRGLPLVLVPIGFHCNIFLGVLLSSIRITWPSQAILLLFMNLTVSAFPISSFSSQFKQTAHGTCKFFIWEQAIEIITNLTSLLFHMLAYIHYSNNNSYQMWSVLFSSNFIIKFTQVYHFYQHFRNGSQGQWNSHHLSIFAHIYMYIWQDTLTPIWTPQFMHTRILKTKCTV